MDFVGPLILKILKMSETPMTLLSINYHVNEKSGKIVNLNIIKSSVRSLVDSNKISERIDKENEIAYYKLIL